MEISIGDALDYARQVKQKFSDETKTFKEFLWWMKLFRSNFIDGLTLSSKLHTLFRGHNDLIQGFHKFFPENHDCTRFPKPQLSDGVEAHEAGGSSSMEAGIKGSSGQRSPPVEAERKGQFGSRSPSRQAGIKGPSGILPGNRKASESIKFLNMVRKKLKNDQNYRQFLEALCKYQAHKDIDCLDKDALNIFRKKPELHVEFSRHLADITEAKYGNKEDMDFVAKERKNSSQDQAKKMTKMNPYQQILFDCEDEMFAADMTFHHLESTKEAAIKCLKNQKNVESKKYGAKEYYNASNLRLIKHLYSSCDEDDDRGYDQVMEEQLLHLNSIPASELILKHLDEKLEELEAWHQKAKGTWAEKIKINHGKARNYELFDEKQKITSGESTFSQENDQTSSHENNVEHAETCMSTEEVH